MTVKRLGAHPRGNWPAGLPASPFARRHERWVSPNVHLNAINLSSENDLVLFKISRQAEPVDGGRGGCRLIEWAMKSKQMWRTA